MAKTSKLGTLPCKWKQDPKSIDPKTGKLIPLYTNDTLVQECGRPSTVYETDVSDTLLAECLDGHAVDLAKAVWKPKLSV